MPDREKPSWNVNPGSVSELGFLIHEAAATYGEPASNSDLAERILIRIRSEKTEASTRRWLRWATALPVAACLVILFMFFAPKTHTPATQSEHEHISVPPPNGAGSNATTRSFEIAQASRAGTSRPRMSSRRTAVAANARSLPKLDTFPAPQALTPEEQALASYASHATEDEQRALIEANNKLEAPLTIAAIEIQPLEPPVPGGN